MRRWVLVAAVLLVLAALPAGASAQTTTPTGPADCPKGYTFHPPGRGSAGCAAPHDGRDLLVAVLVAGGLAAAAGGLSVVTRRRASARR